MNFDCDELTVVANYDGAGEESELWIVLDGQKYVLRGDRETVRDAMNIVTRLKRSCLNWSSKFRQTKDALESLIEKF